jgi:hypothetical protein
LAVSPDITGVTALTAAAGRWLCNCSWPSPCRKFGLWCCSLALGWGYLCSGCRGRPLS